MTAVAPGGGAESGRLGRSGRGGGFVPPSVLVEPVLANGFCCGIEPLAVGARFLNLGRCEEFDGARPGLAERAEEFGLDEEWDVVGLEAQDDGDLFGAKPGWQAAGVEEVRGFAAVCVRRHG